MHEIHSKGWIIKILFIVIIIIVFLFYGGGGVGQLTKQNLNIDI